MILVQRPALSLANSRARQASSSGTMQATSRGVKNESGSDARDGVSRRPVQSGAGRATGQRHKPADAGEEEQAQCAAGRAAAECESHVIARVALRTTTGFLESLQVH